MSNKDTWYYEAEDELIYDIKDVKPGLAFNDWILVKYWGRGSRGYEFLFQCKCGKERVCGLLDMRSGRSKSCRKCSAAVVGATVHKTHGLSKGKVYRTWSSMKTRCYNEKMVKTYKYHGARGIKVADVWLDDFEAFYVHVGEPPTPKHTIDRINADGDYEPGNVRWATQHEQMMNTRRSIAKRAKRKANNPILIMKDGTEIY